MNRPMIQITRDEKYTSIRLKQFQNESFGPMLVKTDFLVCPTCLPPKSTLLHQRFLSASTSLSVRPHTSPAVGHIQEKLTTVSNASHRHIVGCATSINTMKRARTRTRFFRGRPIGLRGAANQCGQRPEDNSRTRPGHRARPLAQKQSHSPPGISLARLWPHEGVHWATKRDQSSIVCFAMD